MEHLKNSVFSLVIPIFNEEEAVPHTFSRLQKLMSSEAYCKLGLKTELVFVNDGSSDKTAEVLNRLIRENNQNQSIQCKVLHFSRNFGHSQAVLAGLEQASGSFIGIIDADLQDPPELLVPMLEKLMSGFDVVYGQRLERQGESFFKRFTAWAFYRMLNWITGVAIPKDTGDFRVMTREVQVAALKFKEQQPFLRGLIAWLGFNQAAFPYERAGREHGVTKYPFKKMLKFAVQALLAFSNLPLQIAIYVCFFTISITVGLSSWALFVHFTGQTVPGWTSLLIVFLFFQSITFAVVGIFGLYISQIHEGVKNRPRYIVRESPSLGSK